MSRKLQDLAWACLPKEMRDKIRKEYGISKVSAQAYTTPSWQTLEWLYGHHNLTSDTEPSELLFVEKNKVIEKWNEVKTWRFSEYFRGRFQMLKELFGDKCLPDKEPSVQGEPKFDKGDKVKIVVSDDGEVATIRARDTIGGQFVYWLEGSLGYYWESQLEPYTEPKSHNLSQETANCDKSEDNQLKDNMKWGESGVEDNFTTKELNLCELLKNSKGEEFYSHSYGVVILDDITSDYRPICVRVKNHHVGREIFYQNGKISKYGNVDLYPSEDLMKEYPLDPHSAWMEWKEARKPKRWTPKNGVQYWFINNLFNCVSTIFDEEEPEDRAKVIAGNCFTTQESCEQAAEAVRETLMKFHSEHTKPPKNDNK